MIKRDILKQNLLDFAQWVENYCNASERSDAQSFFIKFFQAFGYEGVVEAGARFEEPLAKSSKKGRTGFADCIFGDKVIIEMKKKGIDLVHHYNQLETYWTKCTPKPKYAVLCNFTEFWIYDFNIQVDEPIQKISTSELHNNIDALQFMLGKKARFNRNIKKITENAVDKISLIYCALSSPARMKHLDITVDDARRFILQCIFCLFSEDIGLLPSGFFCELLEECLQDPSKSYDLLAGLFTQMNSERSARGGRFKDVKYFNGGLFSKIIPIELTREEIEILIDASNQHWKYVRPSIFGTILESTMDSGERHANGAHFTYESDIYKIVRPTIIQYWEEKIELANNSKTQAKKDKALRALLKELREYKVLDPACGSGNFLYIAYQELKRIEKEILDSIGEDIQQGLSFVTPANFYGMDINPFAVELARLTLEIGRKIAIDKYNLSYENPLPLNNLDSNIVCMDALFTEWEQVDAIVGNPPFLGEKRMRSELTDEYVNDLYSRYKDVPSNIDFCTYWFRLAHDNSATRIGLVASNSIAQGQSRRAGLDYVIDNGGIIHSAIQTQPWSGEAKVHVSLVNWIKAKSLAIKEDLGVSTKYYLNGKSVKLINSSLSDSFDVTQAHRLQQNKNICFQGVKPVGKHFLVSEEKALSWIKQNEKNKDVLSIFSMGRNLTNSPSLLADRWVIDFNDMSLEEASLYKEPFEYAKQFIKPERDKHKVTKLREYWWRFEAIRPGMRKALKRLDFCFAVPRVSKWQVFIAFPQDKMLVGVDNMVVASQDYYILGVLNSKLHRDWVKAQASTLKGDTRYTNTTCFETFPFLWRDREDISSQFTPDNNKANKVDDIMQELDEFRLKQMEQRNYGITKLYNEFFDEPQSKLHKLHQELNKAVCDIYNWKYSPDKNYNEELYNLNQEIYQIENN